MSTQVVVSPAIVAIGLANPQPLAEIALRLKVPFRTVADAETYFRQLPPGEAGCVVTALDQGPAFVSQVVSRQIPATVILATGAEPPPPSLVADLIRCGAYSVLDPLSLDQAAGTGRSAQDQTFREALDVAHEMALRFADRALLAEWLQALSRQDREIATAIVQGWTNKAIANRFEMGLRTVEARRQGLFRKLRVRSLAQFVRRLTYAELLDGLLTCHFLPRRVELSEERADNGGE